MGPGNLRKCLQPLTRWNNFLNQRRGCMGFLKRSLACREALLDELRELLVVEFQGALQMLLLLSQLHQLVG